MKDQRNKLILEYLDIHQSATIRELAEFLRVSVMTVRRDVDALAKNEPVKVVHGVVLNNQSKSDSFESKYYLLEACNYNIDLKTSIAKKACDAAETKGCVYSLQGSPLKFLPRRFPMIFPSRSLTMHEYPHGDTEKRKV